MLAIAKSTVMIVLNDRVTIALPAFVLPVKSAELKWGDVLEKDENETMLLFFEQPMCCYSHLQAAPVTSQIPATKHAHRTMAAVDTLCYVVYNSLSNLKTNFKNIHEHC